MADIGAGSYCPSCGTQVGSNDCFCRACGTELFTQASDADEAQPADGRRRIFAIAAAVVIVALVATGAALWVLRDDDDPVAKPKATASTTESAEARAELTELRNFQGALVTVREPLTDALNANPSPPSDAALAEFKRVSRMRADAISAFSSSLARMGVPADLRSDSDQVVRAYNAWSGAQAQIALLADDTPPPEVNGLIQASNQALTDVNEADLLLGSHLDDLVRDASDRAGEDQPIPPPRGGFLDPILDANE